MDRDHDTAPDTVSIILPAYNEEGELEQTVHKLLQWRDDADITAEIIIVEDGCTDATPEISEQLAAEHDAVRHIHGEHRRGKGAAIKTGFDAATNNILCFMDVDRSVPVSELDALLAPIQRNETDIALGSRYHPDSVAERDTGRDVLSKGYNLIARTVLRTGVRDHQCGFKAITAAAYDTLNNEIEADGWFWDTELLYTANKHGFTVQEVPVHWEEREESAVDATTVATEMLQGLTRVKGEELFGDRFPTLVQFTVFSIIGALGALINTVVIIGLTDVLGIHYMISGALGIEAAIIAMFFLNNRYTFTPVKERFMELVDGIVRSNIVRIGGIAIQLALLYALTEYAGIWYVISNLIAIVIASIFNFFAEKRFNWG